MKNNTIWVLTTHDKYDASVEAFRSKESAINYAMDFLFGEDWEEQMESATENGGGKILDAYDAFYDGYADYKQNGEVWQLHEVTIR